MTQTNSEIQIQKGFKYYATVIPNLILKSHLSNYFIWLCFVEETANFQLSPNSEICELQHEL